MSGWHLGTTASLVMTLSRKSLNCDFSETRRQLYWALTNAARGFPRPCVGDAGITGHRSALSTLYLVEYSVLSSQYSRLQTSSFLLC